MADQELPDNEDIEALHAPLLSKVAGAALALAGIFTLVLGLQTWAVLYMNGWLIAVPIVMLVFGAALAVCGWKTATLRGWAAIAGTVIGGLYALVELGWAIYSISHGLISLLALGVIPLAAGAAILSGFAIPAGLRADQARFRLGEQGWKMGF